MLSSVVAACPRSTRNAVESKAPYALILISDCSMSGKGTSNRWKTSEGGSG